MEESQKKFPELFEKKENCCGCTACYSICPVGAIEMIEDDEGFLYPIVNYKKCIKCYKCLKVCSFKQNQKKRGFFDE